MRYEEEEGHDCGICGDSSAEEVNEKEYSGYKYLCSHCKACNNPNFFPRWKINPSGLTHNLLYLGVLVFWKNCILAVFLFYKIYSIYRARKYIF